jgi:hypothetical protein
MPPEDDESDDPCDAQLVLAKRSPFALTIASNQFTERAEALARRHFHVINSWDALGDQTVTMYRTDQGPMTLREPHAGTRLRKLITTMIVRTRTPLRAETELRAMESLKTRLTVPQWDSYVLNGAFPEQSKRSDLHYIFRKGYPTLVLSYHDEPQGKILAALCLHPMGYYAGTFCGVMTPTDEVIAQLVLMRADERRYWAQSGQWHACDPRSGI